MPNSTRYLRSSDSRIGRRDRFQEEERATRRAGGLRIRLDGHGKSQIGRTRRANQDRYFMLPIGSLPNCFLGVADGIGGGPGGEEASASVVETIQHFVSEESGILLRPCHYDDEIVETLNRGLKRCHAVLQDEVIRRPDWSGMGTTLTAALILWPKMYVVHLGDARGYVLHQGTLRRLTRDHTYGQALLDAGVLNSSTIRTSAMRHVLSNFLSGDLPEKDPEVHPDVSVGVLDPGDAVFLCTDGLSDVIPDDDLLEILSRKGSSEEQCRALLDLAKDREARDDATAVIARFAMADDLPAPSRRHRASS
jgi:serine/threonine protein phosphatase PrpC